MHPGSALPDFYYFCFAIYEPFLTVLGFIGTCFDPKTTHDAQAPWTSHSPPPLELPKATLVTMVQLAHVCALVGVINFFVLSAARKHLHSNLALQEKIVSALLTPLLIGDILHIYVTLWALGDEKWRIRDWSPMLWSTVILGLTLLIPRAAWHLGIGRYVHKWHKVSEPK
ncbi:hypothetical protein AMATHDRAFT_1825 [Amanita thiersii Skay4041]|uniref:DUF7704 domain-containing protein n=1 Tax=Amanita thiersii Skay4041 TaxID=703135 RepID=A0A2A9NY06_9AGAR|nr:hypothetical protein AMATHDRAFT_1825 [Amanita thiersii Skay4041]